MKKIIILKQKQSCKKQSHFQKVLETQALTDSPYENEPDFRGSFRADVEQLEALTLNGADLCL